MPKIFPFRAFRYNLPNPKLKKAVCPPYDVIGEGLAETLRKEPANAIHIELPEGSLENKYDYARQIWNVWKEKNVVARDRESSFYIYNQVFVACGRRYSRVGFFC